jgi:hypothetical protein
MNQAATIISIVLYDKNLSSALSIPFTLIPIIDEDQMRIGPFFKTTFIH